MKKKYYLILLAVLLPLWIIGAGSEIADAFLLRKEGRVATGRITGGKWLTGRSRYFEADVAYTVGEREWHKQVRIPAKSMTQLGATELEINVPLEVLYAPSRPDAAELVIMPSDSPWISVAVCMVGLTGFTTAMIFLYRSAKK